MLIQSFIERLRPLLLGIKSWDYIVLWKLSNDQRFIEWMDCCCAGSEKNYCTDNGGDQDDAVNCTAAANLTPCRDVMFPHARVIQCDLLDQLPSSMLLGSGIHGQTLQSNQVSWLNFVHNSDSSLSHETIGTRVLIPLSLGLLELFVAKQVPEDEQVIEFIRAQCNIFLEPQTGMNNSDSFSSDPNSQNNYQQQIPHENIDLPNDISIERIHLGNNTNNKNNNSSSNGIFVEGGTAYDQPNIFSPSTMDNGILLNGVETTNVPSNSSRRGRRWNNNMDQPSEDQFMIKDDTFLCENNNVRSDDSEPNEDDDEDIDAKYMRRRTNGKGPQSKNLMAERKRRKKLNDRLYSLRALVPKISKLDRASILGDAIDYVKELQKQVEDLQLELEQQPSGDDINEDPTRDDAHVDNSYVPPPSVLSVVTHQNGKNKRDHLENTNGNIAGFVLHNTEYSSGNNSGCLDTSKQYCQDTDSTNPGKVPQQMEPQVEVYELEENELVVKVFSEHKSGGFVRLMEVLTSLGFQVTNVNATRHTCLVSTIFQLERRKDEGTVEADHVKESLLELTRNPSTILLWRSNNITINSNIAAAAAANHFSSENGYNMMQMDSTGGYDHHHIHSHLNHGRQIMNPQYDHHLHRMPH